MISQIRRVLKELSSCGSKWLQVLLLWLCDLLLSAASLHLRHPRMLLNVHWEAS